MTTATEVLEAKALPAGRSTQWAELYALVRGLGDGEQVSIHTDSRFASATVRTHGASYKDRALLPAPGKAIKNEEEILKLLKAVRLPKEVATLPR